MFNNKLIWHAIMANAAIGWVLILLGFIFPVSGLLKAIWIGLALIMIVGHPIELLISFPIGRKAGFSPKRTLFFTLFFGITWWFPVKLGVINSK